MLKRLSLRQKAYLAGFLDGDGSIYVRLKPNKTYRYGFQIAPYIVLFQSSKDRKEFEKICSFIRLGYMRERKDKILEYVIGRQNEIRAFLAMIKPYLILKKKQAELMIKILNKKEKIRSIKDFQSLMKLINSYEKLNHSKRRKTYINPVETWFEKKPELLHKKKKRLKRRSSLSLIRKVV